MGSVAIYPGTFDPLTLGHEDIVFRASRLFDRVIVAVAVAHHKKTWFSLEERMALVKTRFSTETAISVLPFDGLVVHFAHNVGANVMVRGLRGSVDFDYEMQLAGMNRALITADQPNTGTVGIDTVFLPASSQVQAISSSLVKEIAKLEGNFSGFVSTGVHSAIQMKLNLASA